MGAALRIRWFVASVALWGALVAASPAGAAAPPSLVNYQGVLRDAANVPINGSRDMVFRFFDSPAPVVPPNNEILVDRHEAAGSGPVVVSGGLFSVLLGGGIVSDGSGPGTYASLADLFRDFEPVFLEVAIEGERLMPRIRIASAAFALNAGYALNAGSALDAAAVGGVPAASFLRSDTSDTFSSGMLTLAPGTTLDVQGQANLNGALRMDADGPEGSPQAVYFYNNGSAQGEFFEWNDPGDHFRFSDDVAVGGILRVGSGDATGLTYSSIGTGVPDSGLIDSTQDLYVANDLEVDGSLKVEGNLEFHDAGPDGDQAIYFYEDGTRATESIRWVDADDSFQITDELQVTGAIRTGILTPPVSYNCFSNGVACAPDSGAIGNNGDVYVQSDMEVDGGMYLNGALHLDDDGPDGDQNLFFYNGGVPTGAWLRFDDGPDQFKTSHGLSVTGSLDASSLSVLGTINASDLGAANTITAFSLGVTHGQVFGDLDVGGGLTVTGTSQLGNLDVDGALTVDGASRFGTSIFSSSHQLTVENSASDDTLRLIGPGANFGYLARLNFGDADFAFIDEPSDDELRIHGGGGVGINGAPTGGGGALQVFGNAVVFGAFTATGAKSFVQNHPERPDQSVVYVALEGDEAGTYTRGSGRLRNGEARVRLGETFAWVTNPDVGLTAQVTPRGGWADLYVESVSTTEIVVRSRDGAAEAAFDYLVHGLRIGYENFPVVQERRFDARIPSEAFFEAGSARAAGDRPETALARFRDSESEALGRQAASGAGVAALRRGIGEFDTDPHPTTDQKDLAAAPVTAYLSPAADLSMATASRAPAAIPAAPTASGPVTVQAPSEARPEPAQGYPPVDAAGNVYARSFRPSAPDLATLAPVGEPVEPGDVLAIDPGQPGVLTVARADQDARVFGIVAAAPGVILGSPGPPRGDAPGPAAPSEGDAGRRAAVEAPVAFSGVVACKVDAGYGAIRPGDLLTTSETAGHARRADNPQPGTVLGKALEPLEAGTGTILVLVTLR